MTESTFFGTLQPIKIKLEKNSKGFNYEISVAGEEVDEIMALIAEANEKLEAAYGSA